MLRVYILTTYLLLVILNTDVTANNCKINLLQKCADVIEFLSDRPTVFGGSETIDDLCQFTKNSTICANKAVENCPSLKDEEEYKTLIRVADNVDTEVCVKNSEVRKAYDKYESCLKKIQENSLIQCVQDFLVVLRVLKESTDKDICCAYVDSKDCIQYLVNSKCGSEASNATVHVASLLFSPLTEPRCLAYNATLCKLNNMSSYFKSNFFFVFFAFSLMLFIRS